MYSVAFSPGGSLVASASADGTAKLWRVSDRALLHTLTGHSAYGTNDDEFISHSVFSVDFSPVGTLLLTSGADGSARLWRVDDGTQVRVMDGGSGVIARFSADGKTAYATDTRNIWFWRVSDGRLLAKFADVGAHSLAVSPDGKHFAYGTGGGTVVLARVPLWIEQVQQAGDELILRWQGGSGLYQLQRAQNALTGPWADVSGPTTATGATNTITGTVFYRVQSLSPP